MLDTPTISLMAILPEVLLTVGLLVALFRAVFSNVQTSRWLAGIASGTLLAAFVATGFQWWTVQTSGVELSFSDMIVLDHRAVIGRIVLLVIVALALSMNWAYVARLGTRGGEALALILLATIGFMFMGTTNHLIMLFLGLEIGSISLYVLAALGQETKRSDEAALKYFLLGSVASGIFVYGAALLFTGTGALHLDRIGSFLTGNVIFADGLITLGIALLLVGLLFKIAVAPFHTWAPDVYQGSPAGVVGFMAAAAKVGAMLALLRLIEIPFRSLVSTYQVPLATLAAVSVVIGTLYAVVQGDLRRLLAYSGIAHAGYLLMAIAAGPSAAPAMVFYLIGYVVMLVAGFGIVALVEGPGTSGSPIDNYKGLGRRSPYLSSVLALLLFGMSGMPFTVGFVTKLALFRAVWAAELEWLVITGLVASVAGFFFYLRVIIAMFFEEGDGDTPRVGLASTIALGVTVVVVVGLGVYPTPLIETLRSVLG